MAEGIVQFRHEQFDLGASGFVPSSRQRLCLNVPKAAYV